MTEKTIIIGITGGTGSGKTTVVKRIVEALPSSSVAVVPLDSYYNDQSNLSIEERQCINFDHPDAFDWKLLKEHINLLKKNNAIEQPTYSYLVSNRLEETIHIEPKPVIIIEGILALCDNELRNMMDIKIFVDCDSDERLIRNIQRDTVNRGRNVEDVINRYIKVLKPMHELFIEPTKQFANIIIPEGGNNAVGIDMLCKYIENISDKINKL